MRGSSSTKTVDALKAPADVTEIFSAFDSFVLSRTNSSSRESALERHARITRSRYSQNVPTIPVEFSGKYFLLEIAPSRLCVERIGFILQTTPRRTVARRTAANRLAAHRGYNEKRVTIQRPKLQLESGQDFGADSSRIRGAGEQLVAGRFEGEDFERAVGHIRQPIFLYGEAGIEFAFIVAVAAQAAGGNDFHQQVWRTDDPTGFEQTGVGSRNENEIGLDDIFFIQDHINRREKDLAKFVGLNVPLDREENPACPTLMGKFRCRRHESLAVDYFKADVIAKAQILF